MQNLRAIELGNEPEYYAGANQAIAVAAGSWTPVVDAKSQNNWIAAVGQSLGSPAIIQAGNSNTDPPTWGAAELIPNLNSTSRSYVHDYSHHNYPGGTVTSLMSHSGIVNNMKKFKADVAAAVAVGKEYVLGETNSGKIISFSKSKTTVKLTLCSFWRWSFRSKSNIRSSSLDYGLRTSRISSQHKTNLFPPRYRWTLLLLLVGSLLHGSSILRGLCRTRSNG
jgi:hypothetical protein